MTRGLIGLLLAIAPLWAGCGDPCQAGFVLVNGVCTNPDGGSGACRSAPPGLYQGLTDQGLPVSFRLSEDRSRVTDFAIDTLVSGPGAPSITHQIRWEAGFQLVGCGFSGAALGGEFSGSFVPPHSFAGLWGDTIQTDGSFFSGSGTWTAVAEDLDGGTPDGGAAEDGGAADGGATEDGGVADGGVAADGGLADGGSPGPLVVPEGFTAEVWASGLAGPIAVAVEPGSGDVLVAESLAGTVRRLSAGGAPETLLTGLVQPRGLSLVSGAPPRIYASHEGGITVVELGGAGTSFGPALTFPPGPLACDDAPQCFVAELRIGERRQAVWRVSATQATQLADAAAGIDQPFGVALAGPEVLVAEANLGFPSADGVFFHAIGLDGGAVTGFTPVPLVAQPGSLAPLGDGRFFVGEVVSAGGNDRAVYLLDRSGPTSQAFARGFSLPTGIAFDGARQVLYVSDLGRGLIYAVRGGFGSL